jgi:hypothetical protein
MFSGAHNMQVLRGLTSSRSLLSCTGDGTKVDLWSKDDGSGRQRWTFVPIKVQGEEEVYNIIVESGLSSNRKYLSCTSDGTKVDLWSKDDGSGRQRWEIFPVQNSPTPDTYIIKVCEGVATDRRYLSCTADGGKVDLYSKDDGSGRQRWQIQGVWKA